MMTRARRIAKNMMSMGRRGNDEEDGTNRGRGVAVAAGVDGDYIFPTENAHE